MPRFAWILLLLQLAAVPLRPADFTGQVGSIDEAQLGMDWYLLGPGEFPILPLEGVTVSMLGCGEDCPDPVHTDPDGRFRFPDTASTDEAWPGMCKAPRNEWVSVSKYLLVPSPLPKRNLSPPAGFQCGFLYLH